MNSLREGRFLIVDDTDVNVRLLERILAGAGATQVRSTTDSRLALDLFREFRPDIVLLDLHMPHLDGFGVLSELKRVMEKDDFLPVVVLTADTSAGARERALAQGANDFLTKPFDRMEVVLRINNLLLTRQLHEGLRARNRSLEAEVRKQAELERQAAEERRLRLERLRPVLGGTGLRMVFQPLVGLDSGRIVGVEALARFEGEPGWGPDKWFAEAADLGVGQELELAAVRAAVAQLDELPADVYMAFNVSPATAISEELVSALAHLPHDRLVLELTEHTRVEDYQALILGLTELRKEGIRLAVDDAGAGFASLSHILRLAPDIIKLDLSLTRGIETDPVRRALAAALVTFSADIGVRVAAEGIETAEAIGILKGLGVHAGQGYFLARPAPLPLPAIAWDPALPTPAERHAASTVDEVLPGSAARRPPADAPHHDRPLPGEGLVHAYLGAVSELAWRLGLEGQGVTLADAAPVVLEAVGEGLGWDAGVVWDAGDDGDELACVGVWQPPGTALPPLADAVAAGMRGGTGLARHVRDSGRAAWVGDRAGGEGGSWPAGTRSTFAFPISGSRGVLGVAQFFRTNPSPQDPEMLGMAEAIGTQVGATVERGEEHAETSFRADLLHAQAQAAPGAVLVSSPEGRVLFYNHQLLALLDLAEEAVEGRPLPAVLGELACRAKDGDAFSAFVERMGAEPDERGDRELAVDDRVLHVLTTPVFGADGNRYGRSWYFRDLTEQRRAEARFRSLLHHASDLLCVADPAGTVLYATPGIGTVLGGFPEELAGTPVFDLFAPEEQGRLGALLEGVLAESGASACAEVEACHRDGSNRLLEVVFTNLVHDPAVGGLALSGRDVTERRADERRLAQRALHDALTGLPNRALFMERLGHALAHAERQPDDSVAVLFADLDGFKAVNDRLGHAAGDELLATVGARIVDALRRSDTVARLGGDEFAVICEDVAGERSAIMLAERVLTALERPFELEAGEARIRASIGLAYATQGRARSESLVAEADAAMYLAKRRGGGNYEVFDDAMRARSRERLQTEESLGEALRRGQLRLFYQPVVDVGDGHAVGYEALLRWDHPERGVLAPLQFLSSAEETPLILSIDRWVLLEACRQALTWQNGATSAYVAVNLSARQLVQPDVAEWVSTALERSGLPRERLHLEIAEPSLRDDRTVVALGELKELGVELVIDNFGTGAASLSALAHFPIDGLNVDRSVISRVGANGEEPALLAAVLGVAGPLGLTVVAQGVETAPQLAQLRALGCPRAQGHLFSAARPPEQLGHRYATSPAGPGGEAAAATQL